MTSYLRKSFSVASPHTKEYGDNYERTFRGSGNVDAKNENTLERLIDIGEAEGVTLSNLLAMGLVATYSEATELASAGLVRVGGQVFGPSTIFAPGQTYQVQVGTSPVYSVRVVAREKACEEEVFAGLTRDATRDVQALFEAAELILSVEHPAARKLAEDCRTVAFTLAKEMKGATT